VASSCISNQLQNGYDYIPFYPTLDLFK